MPPSVAAAVPAGAIGTGKEVKFTWDEVARHNTKESLWVTMGGKVYDLTEFAAKHPGGSTMIYLAAGREVTDLFAMYHVFNEESARKFIKPYEIGVLDGPAEFGGFPVEPKGGFYDTLKTRVKAHFEAAKQDPRDPLPALLRMVPTFIVAFATFAAIHHPYFALPFAAKLLLSVVYGIAQALPLLHLMHDCSHGSLTKAGWVWDVVGQFVFDWFAGGSMAAWHHQHVLGHHVYTNVYGSDPDLPTRETGDMRRIIPRQKLSWLYRFQHIYLPIVYGLLTLKVRTDDVLCYVYYKTNGPVRVNWVDNVMWRAVGVKLMWLGWRAVLPMLVWGMSFSTWLACFLTIELTTGYWLAYNFQVSHVTEGAVWPNGAPADSTRQASNPAEYKQRGLPESWAVTQVRTSLDYWHDSSVWTFLCGALNYQTEHHLFPGISQYQYPAIAPIVRQTCKEFGLPYLYAKDFPAAFAAHWRYLKAMGSEGKAVHVD